MGLGLVLQLDLQVAFGFWVVSEIQFHLEQLFMLTCEDLHLVSEIQQTRCHERCVASLIKLVDLDEEEGLSSRVLNSEGFVCSPDQDLRVQLSLALFSFRVIRVDQFLVD